MKSHIKSILASAIVLIVFNIVAFVLPFTKGTTFWSGYIFAMISLILVIGVAYVSNSSERPLQSRFYRWPILTVAGIYAVVQLFASLIFMAVTDIPPQVAIIISVILLGVALLGILATSVASDKIQEIDNVVKPKVAYIKVLESDLSALVGQCSDSGVRKKVASLAEAVRYSDPMSADILVPLEDTIRLHINILTDALQTDRTDTASAECDQIMRLLDERNRKCKLLK